MSVLVAVSIGLGGALGALLRALTGRWIQGGFPWATLLVNITGSFLLAAAYTGLPMESEIARACIGTGFCGAFTTFSTFILDTIILARSGLIKRAAGYLGGTLVLCSLASWSGFYLMS
jgi:CrcB protein